MTALWWIAVIVPVLVALLLAHRLGQAREGTARLDARLAGVLEATSAGLSVWSADGRLRGCNARFREFYPRAPIKPGVVFEDLIRYTANRGLVRLPADDRETVEAWVGERVGRFGRPHYEVVRTAEGRWLDIHTHTAASGEVLMVFGDTTAIRDAAGPVSDTSARLERRAGDLEAAVSLVRDLRQASSDEAAVQGTIARVCDWAGFLVGHGYRVGEGPQALVPLPCWYVSAGSDGSGEPREDAGDSYAALRETVTTAAPASGEGLAGRVLRSGRIVWVPNATVDPTVDEVIRAVLRDLHGGCAVPVRTRERTLAVLVFYSRRPLTPDRDTERILKLAGETLAWSLTTRNAG